jgi:hypothetical protein
MQKNSNNNFADSHPAVEEDMQATLLFLLLTKTLRTTVACRVDDDDALARVDFITHTDFRNQPPHTDTLRPHPTTVTFNNIEGAF